MIKSPLRYPDRKSRAVGTIAKLLPDFDEFREPFLGGGSVFVYVKQRYPDKKFWINDLLSFANIQTWNLTYGMRNITDNSDQNGKELFISNYKKK